MSNALDRISTEETRMLADRRRRKNWLVFGLLAAFVIAVFFLSLTHVRTEMNTPQSAAEPR